MKKYRIKKINWFGKQKYVIQKRSFLCWKNIKDRRGYPTIFDTRKGAEVLLGYYKKNENEGIEDLRISG